jgi:hypothetical protein
MHTLRKTIWIALATLLFVTCKNRQAQTYNEIQNKVEQFIEFDLTADLSVLHPTEKQMLPYLFEAARIMDSLFWIQAYGDKTELMGRDLDQATKQFIEINYGPWERLNNNKPFVDGFGPKPAGANFYPGDITLEEFGSLQDTTKDSQYTMLSRDENGQLKVLPYHEFFKEGIDRASMLILKASGFAVDPGLKKYLELRAEALLTDDYLESDMAWMDMKTNQIDFVVGPIENYEDNLLGRKTAFEAYILIKDTSWSNLLEKYAALLPRLQQNLPVEARYKQESPGSNSDLGAYEVVYYAGDCNAGAKSIAINLPNDERVHLEKGSRRLQLKNAMQAKFDKILVPISKVLIAEEQQAYVNFDAFFENVMFHEVAHGLGIKNTLNGSGTVREALKEQYSAIEEGKADILGLFMVDQLSAWNELDTDLMGNYVTFMAGIFRSIRFGASSAHGQANLLRYNYFREMGAFTRDADGYYSIDFEKMKEAMVSLSELILIIQGDGDYERAVQLMEEKCKISDELQSDLDRINASGIPLDIRFNQGEAILGLE